jgi:DNA invertase Pin-like site-specific DNA recombinase
MMLKEDKAPGESMMKTTPKIVAYYRVSTKRQGESGLGLEGQKMTAKEHATRCEARIIAEYKEVESGKRHQNRPQLAAAMAHAKSARATLVVAKLDRLARNVAFVSALMESGVEFVACDNPTANRVTIHILAAIAEDESRRISERTIKALEVVKKKGKPLGSAKPGHWEGRMKKGKAMRADRRAEGGLKGTKIAAQRRTEKAREANRLVCQIITELRSIGTTWSKVADTLNEAGHVSQRGNPWSAATACQVFNDVCRKMSPTS